MLAGIVKEEVDSHSIDVVSNFQARLALAFRDTNTKLVVNYISAGFLSAKCSFFILYGVFVMFTNGKLKMGLIHIEKNYLGISYTMAGKSGLDG